MPKSFPTEAPQTTGANFVCCSDLSNSRDWPGGLTGYVVTDGGSGDSVLQLVDPTHGLPVVPATGVTFAVTGTFWQATQPVSLVSVPTHAVTQSGVWSVVTDINSYGGMTAIVANFDTGGFQGIPLHGIALPAAGGGVVGGTATHPFRTDPTGTTTQPVSGTVTVNAGAGTFAISAAALPLPTGAATAANQATGNTTLTAISTNTGNVASCANNDYDGRSPKTLAIAGYDTNISAFRTLTALASAPADPNVGLVVRNIPSGTQAVSVASVPTHAVTQSGTWSVRVQDGGGNSLTSATRGAQQALSVQIVDGSGNQVTSFGGSGGTASNYGSAFPATGTSAGYSDGTNMQGARVFDLDSGAGSQYVLGVGLRLSASGGSVEAGTGTNPIRTDPTGTTTQPVSIAAAVAVTQSGGWSVSISGTPSVNAQYTGFTSDYDTGAGTTNVTAFGIALPASGGPVAGGTATNPIRTDTTGTTTQPVSGTFWQATQPVSGTVTANQGGTWNIGTVTTVTGVTTVSTLTSLTQFNGNVIDTNSGVKSGGTLRVVLATDQPALTNKLLVTPDANSAINVAQVAGATVATGHGTASGALRVELPTDGTGIVGAAQSGTWTVQPGNTQNTTAWLVTDVPATSGGWTSSRVKSAASTNATSVKASAGQIGGWYLYNNTASAKFLKFYNKASSPTVGTDTPLFTVPIPANGGTNIEYGKGIACGTGIAYAITGAIADSDTTSTAADDVHGTILYK